MQVFRCLGFNSSMLVTLRILAYWLLIFLCQSQNAQASSLTPVLLGDDSGSKFPVVIELLEDSEAKLTLQDVVSTAMEGRFTAFEGIILNFGYTHSAVWARFKVSSQTGRRWLLMLNGANRDAYFEVYAVPDSKPKAAVLPQRLKQLALYPDPVYLMDFDEGETYTIYLYTRSLNSPLFCCVLLSPEDDFTAGVQLRQLFFGLALGACLALALYNLLLFFTFYEYSYINLFGLITFMMFEAGHGLFLTFIEYESYLRVRYVFAILAMMFFLQVIRQIAVPKDIKWRALDTLANRALKLLMIMAVILIAILPFLEFKQFYFTIFMGLSALTTVVVVVRAAWLNRPMARTLLLALLFLIILTVGPPVAGGLGTHLFSVGTCIGGLIEATGLILFLLTLSLMQISRTRQLRDDRERAESANQAKSHFLTTMTHELRTPMNAIVGIGSLMKSTRLDTEQRDYIEKLSVASEHLLALINDVLDFSEIEQTEITLDSEVFNVHQMVADIEKILVGQAAKKGLTLQCDCQLPDSTYIKGDAMRLMQTILNLCSNAIKFTDQGRIRLLIEPLTVDVDDKTALRFVISDTGIGINNEALKCLFQPFTQVEKGTKRSYGGSGLGLFISKQLVSAMGGN